jgi:hypothetical protein
MAGQHAARRCLRDELFLLAHDEHDRWRPRVSTRSLAVGLAGAALVDLLLTGNLRADSGHVTARSRYVRHGLDPICARIVADLAMTSAWIPVREAVIGTAADLYEYTLIHLITTDLITAQGRRLGRGFRYRGCW